MYQSYNPCGMGLHIATKKHNIPTNKGHLECPVRSMYQSYNPYGMGLHIATKKHNIPTNINHVSKIHMAMRHNIWPKQSSIYVSGLF